MLGVKLPFPPLQMPPVAPAMLPFKAMVALFTQAELLAPAFTDGAAVKAITTWSLVARQLLFPLVVNVRVTEPLAISAAVGV